MKTIELTQGKVTVVDDDVYEWASKFKWRAQKGLRTFYAVRQVTVASKKKTAIYLHREILLLDKKSVGDHQDGDGLNNLRYNLRPATPTQNQHNRRKTKNHTSSSFKGVTWHKQIQKWQAQISVVAEKITYLGCFQGEEAAARAYDTAAIKYFGEYALLNFPEVKII